MVHPIRPVSITSMPNSDSVNSFDQRMVALCRYIEAHADETVSLTTMAQYLGLSPSYLQRRFKQEMGVSPREYQAACRIKCFKTLLREGVSVTQALYEVGYGSSSRLYEATRKSLGMTPRQFQMGAQAIPISYAFGQTPMGSLLLAATDKGLCFVSLGEEQDTLLRLLRAEFPGANLAPMPADQGAFRAWMASLNDYLTQTQPQTAHALLQLPLDIAGTVFQQKVWRYLQTIPYGSVKTYAEVATAIGHPKAVRAVGSACGANRLALLIPCHRVIRGDGGLGGYRWGQVLKQQLLLNEQGYPSREVG